MQGTADPPSVHQWLPCCFNCYVASCPIFVLLQTPFLGSCTFCETHLEFGQFLQTCHSSGDSRTSARAVKSISIIRLCKIFPEYRLIRALSYPMLWPLFVVKNTTRLTIIRSSLQIGAVQKSSTIFQSIMDVSSTSCFSEHYPITSKPTRSMPLIQ